MLCAAVRLLLLLLVPPLLTNPPPPLRYATDTRPWIPFHCDAAEITANVALTDDTDGGGGGQLLAVCGGEVRPLRRVCGDATVHSSALLHAVSAVRKRRVRYSLILFFRYE